ncbi:uncharacterized protein LOC9654631 [Selaginella moellendorffii]|uniref:uncharacterized protein LOC9654631 n=1 Tax=Selaginella moellendorffii TaxID=88036 RepID=UPI000D1D1200|nr:uncharacterized protein LOC9654631 [Selaginella moellendorffii]|eukprot:XP_024543993.1 uncharacterized protein LOC9654631 [Selaginella moellendorffii]
MLKPRQEGEGEGEGERGNGSFQSVPGRGGRRGGHPEHVCGHGAAAQAHLARRQLVPLLLDVCNLLAALQRRRPDDSGLGRRLILHQREQYPAERGQAVRCRPNSQAQGPPCASSTTCAIPRRIIERWTMSPTRSGSISSPCRGISPAVKAFQGGRSSLGSTYGFATLSSPLTFTVRDWSLPRAQEFRQSSVFPPETELWSWDPPKS